MKIITKLRTSIIALSTTYNAIAKIVKMIYAKIFRAEPISTTVNTLKSVREKGSEHLTLKILKQF